MRTRRRVVPTIQHNNDNCVADDNNCYKPFWRKNDERKPIAVCSCVPRCRRRGGLGEPPRRACSDLKPASRDGRAIAKKRLFFWIRIRDLGRSNLDRWYIYVYGDGGGAGAEYVPIPAQFVSWAPVPRRSGHNIRRRHAQRRQRGVVAGHETHIGGRGPAATLAHLWCVARHGVFSHLPRVRSKEIIPVASVCIQNQTGALASRGAHLLRRSVASVRLM